MSNPIPSAPARQRATAKKSRSVMLVRPLGSEIGGDGVIRLSANGKVAFYWCREVATQLGGRAFSLKQQGVGTSGDEYDVHCGEHKSCTCIGFAAHSRCKHSDGLTALIAAGKLTGAN